MKILYKYLYHRLYSWNLKKWGKGDMPQWNALFGVTFVMFLNIVFLAGILDKYLIEIFNEDISRSKIISITALLLFINYFLFLHNKNYKKISHEFNNESQKTRNIKALLLWLYFLLSFVALYILIII